MSNKEILEKAISQAIDGGWKGAYPEQSDVDIRILCHELNDWQVIKVWFISIVGDTTWDVQRLIFSHEFAKALWGEKPEYGVKTYTTKREMGMFIPWEWHLQQMILAEDPIKYLGQNL